MAESQTKHLRKFTGDTLVVASHNAGKVREINDLLRPLGVKAISASTLDLPEPEETETTFIGNAKLKALSAARLSGLPALSDDSGLAVDVLGGDPGIYSARWAGPEKDFNSAMQKVENAVQNASQSVENQSHTLQSGGKESQKFQSAPTAPENLRRAHFICALCLAWPDDHLETFEGRVSGNLVWPPRGENGFGYDPVFQADGYDITFGEMEPARKHAISHRANAFAQLLDTVFTNGQT